jgi:hypothetical protein
MKYLATALAISFGMGMVLFGIVYPMFHDAHLAAGIAAIPIAGCHHIAEMLERREARQSVAAHRVTDIHSFADYVVAWPLLVAQTTVTLIGIYLTAGVFAASLVPFFLGSDLQITRILEIGITWASAPIVLAGAFFVGRWIGSRCAQASAATVLLVVALVCLVVYGLGAVLSNVATSTFDRASVESFVTETVICFAALAIAGLLGHRQGRKRRVAEYMDYLLSILPPETGKVLVELAYDEARKTKPATVPGDRHLRTLARAS